jgi:uncharacterized cupredoxin-like copper-binding protein
MTAKGRSMRLARLALLPALALVAVACSPGTAGTPAPTPGVTAPTGVPSAAPSDVPATQPPASVAASPVATPAAAAARIEVLMTDRMTFEPAVMTVPAGVPVTFVVTNGGVLEHEFYLGDEAAQVAHEAEMLEMGGMTHDDPEGIAVDPGDTRELVYTFEAPGETLAGCHVAGHYLAGMKATIKIEG